jgi:hypothetical protein
MKKYGIYQVFFKDLLQRNNKIFPVSDLKNIYAMAKDK